MTQRIQNTGQGYMGISMLGHRQAMPRWVNDSMCLNNGRTWDIGQGRV